MHVFYMDDSKDEHTCVFSAIAMPAHSWREAFASIKAWRRSLRIAYGIPLFKELHAWKFVSGRGRPSETQVLTKSLRASIFAEGLRVVASLPDVRVYNAVFPKKQEDVAFERLVNRFNRALKAWDSYGILISDEGKEAAYTRLIRRMGVFNPIPSQFGSWNESGRSYRNIPIDRLIEDPFFKQSDQSYFIQATDFIAFALLRRERPIASRSKYGIHLAFDQLGSVLAREASRSDPEGILRA